LKLLDSAALLADFLTAPRDGAVDAWETGRVPARVSSVSISCGTAALSALGFRFVAEILAAGAAFPGAAAGL